MSYESPFPAHAGMNRERSNFELDELAVPRARGDEPSKGFKKVEKENRSPRTRG